MTTSPKSEKTIQLIRWIAVLPTAVLALLAARFLVGFLIRLAGFGGSFAQGESGFVYYLQLLVLYCPKEAAFVIAGAKMAPRNRRTTALVLAFAAVLTSLTIHVLGQTNPGVVNYTHFAADSGAAYIYFSENKTRRSALPSDDNG